MGWEGLGEWGCGEGCSMHACACMCVCVRACACVRLRLMHACIQACACVSLCVCACAGGCVWASCMLLFVPWASPSHHLDPPPPPPMLPLKHELQLQQLHTHTLTCTTYASAPPTCRHGRIRLLHRRRRCRRKHWHRRRVLPHHRCKQFQWWHPPQPLAPQPYYQQQHHFPHNLLSIDCSCNSCMQPPCTHPTTTTRTAPSPADTAGSVFSTTAGAGAAGAVDAFCSMIFASRSKDGTRGTPPPPSPAAASETGAKEADVGNPVGAERSGGAADAFAAAARLEAEGMRLRNS